MNTTQKGFTLIELLVVIAIIGILASVVLASLNTARKKGADAKIKSELVNARTQAELYYNTNQFSYGGICSDSTFISMVNDDLDGGGNNCQDSDTAWAVSVTLNTPGAEKWCVDSTGFSGIGTPNPSANPIGCVAQ